MVQANEKSQLNFFYLVVAVCFFNPTHSKAEWNNQEAFAFYLENDSRNIGGPGSDRAYTNGFKFSRIYARDKIPPWSKNLIEIDPLSKQQSINFGISLGQQIYTPNSIKSSNLITNDRPYASWLYVGLALSRKEENKEKFLELDIGTVGPNAMGENMQNGFHRIIHTQKAKGWKNQLKNEPTFQFFYQERIKFKISPSLDFIPFYGAGLGNVMAGLHIGGMLRFGYNLPDNFGPSRPSASEGNSFITPHEKALKNRSSHYLFASSRGNTIFRNIFLDGNTFQKSHHVSKYLLTYDFEFGYGMEIEQLAFVWSFVTRSPEFKQKNSPISFASVNLVYFY